ncbi:MAG: acyl-CoA thioesterase [Spirochaetales bacterium]|nr:acyl-CoA thioesterase [Spirochaetales bacterium]
MNQKYIYKLEFLVRDYECDLQGIVNNAVYQNYLEHARHEFLQSADVDFAKLHTEGIDPVVTRVELDYKYPLKSQDKFIVSINLYREGQLRFIFDQTIIRLSDEQVMLEGKITAVFLQNGRPVKPDNIIGTILDKYNIM